MMPGSGQVVQQTAALSWRGRSKAAPDGASRLMGRELWLLAGCVAAFICPKNGNSIHRGDSLFYLYACFRCATRKMRIRTFPSFIS
jgi:hypothetical protein